MPSFGELRTKSLGNYLAGFRGRGLLFFMHIPKTAGSSLSADLREALPPYRNLDVDFHRTDIPVADRLRAAVDAFATADEVNDFASASGHIPFALAGPILRARPDLRMVTILRDPVARVVSDYRYQRTEMHPPHLQFRARFPTLESYVEHPVSQNKMTTFVAGQNITEQQMLNRVEQAFAFIGLLEFYDFSVSTLFALAGRASPSTGRHLRRTPDNAETAVTLTPCLERRIIETNSLDRALYCHVRTILLPHVDAWTAAQARASD